MGKIELKIELSWKETIFIFGICIIVIALIICGINMFPDIKEVLIFEDNFWNGVTAVSTLMAAVFALMSYRQSIKMRRHASFDAIFSQLLINLQGFINNPLLQSTNMDKKKLVGRSITNITEIDVFVLLSKNERNSFWNFCDIYKRYSTWRNPFKLDENEIEQLWRTYTNSLTYESNYLNCFKYIYHMVNVVVESPLDEKKKSQYIGIIQAQLNLDVLFCYLINQIAASRGYNSSYIQILKKYGFFSNLFKDYDGYDKIIKTSFPNSIYMQYC